jgi:hypothetical protein
MPQGTIPPKSYPKEENSSLGNIFYDVLGNYFPTQSLPWRGKQFLGQTYVVMS